MVLRALPKIIDQLPASCQRYKLLPEILKSLEFAGTSNWCGTPAPRPFAHRLGLVCRDRNLLAALLKVSAHLPQAEYTSKIAPVVVNYFAVQDRSLRITLLQVRARARLRSRCFVARCPTARSLAESRFVCRQFEPGAGRPKDLSVSSGRFWRLESAAARTDCQIDAAGQRAA